MVAQWKIINENYKNLEGYKRVAWPPASEERIIREFTPQPATQSPAPGSGGYYPQSVAAPPSHAAAAPPQPQQQQQPSQLPYSQDQPDLQQQPGAFAGQDSYRGASPGIITLRKEAPVTQKPAPVYTSQPAAVSYQGGSKLRGDLKWPPPEYKEAAARENEERRLLALGPVCRPRRVNRDYTGFFAKHQLNNAYPTYKVPPGTQHMFA
ncbi:cell division protein ZipA isoform X19 [Drosophila ananassae]|uniref:cell division protein ZipA isoform X19 n=1 Tax=Drosophila ananassae TaxID=7217 RepID=UPI001CFF6D6E|nr:cell division protein ZipA isoform X19 [Drosophila ananassae]